MAPRPYRDLDLVWITPSVHSHFAQASTPRPRTRRDRSCTDTSRHRFARRARPRARLVATKHDRHRPPCWLRRRVHAVERDALSAKARRCLRPQRSYRTDALFQAGARGRRTRTPTASYSARRDPIPRPRTMRPPERLSIVDTRLASTAGLCRGAIHDGGPRPHRFGHGGDIGERVKRIGHGSCPPWPQHPMESDRSRSRGTSGRTRAQEPHARHPRPTRPRTPPPRPPTRGGSRRR